MSLSDKQTITMEISGFYMKKISMHYKSSMLVLLLLLITFPHFSFAVGMGVGVGVDVGMGSKIMEINI